MHDMFLHAQHRIDGHLGSGHFANVEQGKWLTSDGEKEVAIKSLHRETGSGNRIKCLQEAAIMAQFHHPNIVLLHGIIIDEERNVREYSRVDMLIMFFSLQISLIMEFLHGGDLNEILVNRYILQNSLTYTKICTRSLMCEL